ncbi:hypothetical protein Q668_10305 [Alcanivorax sp. PN-3]|jgi:uncharacterized membrane protein|uniref:hypothetical protein n=1 Tax=Alloalcanivorax xenomutans TaxID=1094342 RepID=UPI0003B86D5C|nr:hypothetical protein Q668_10305 [Alcanivorax sp. PN-3]
MRALLGTVLGLPLALMLCGLLAAILPVDWRQWLVLYLLLSVVLWSALITLAALPASHWRTAVWLVAANGVAWIVLQTTGLYGASA